MKNIPGLISNLRSAGSSSRHVLSPSFCSDLFPKTTSSNKVVSSHWKPILSNLLNNYEIDEARRVFSQIPSPDVRLYTMMIAGYSRINRINEALDLFAEMPVRDVASWNSIIQGCLDCGDLWRARELFDNMPEKNVISWTTIINGLLHAGSIDAAEELFARMPHRDTAAWNAMISGYCNNGRIQEARLLFGRVPRPNVISWTAMISGYDQNGESHRALLLFQEMLVLGIKPTSSTFACVLTACGNISNLTLGCQIHACLVKYGHLFDTYVCTSLLTMYANCKQIENSCIIFEETEQKNLVAWTALLTGYGSNGRHEEALDEFHKLLVYGIKPNSSTYTSALNSCCGLEAIDRGLKIHTRTIKQGLDLDVFVGNSLVVLYSKCGAIDFCLKVFNDMTERNIVSWNATIVGCAQNGYASLAIDLFKNMSGLHMQPDEITYIGLLSACSHSKMYEEGKHFFQMLERDPSVELKLEHYACMVDVLGRSGNMDEAEEFIRNMRIRPNATVWIALLSACRIHCNVEVAQRTAEMIFDVDPCNSAAYVLLSNIYASAGRWNDVSQVRVMMRCRGIVKVPGCSWITLKDRRHEFVCNDRSHPMTKEIYKKLEWLGVKLKEYGYIHNRRFVLHDVDDEQKEAVLSFHSEKIAIAFGLVSTVKGSTIRVMKNLRVCGDCHSAIKMISKIVMREIVLRDSSRFHHFSNGCCSCGDCW